MNTIGQFQDINKVREVIKQAFTAAQGAQPQRPSGCGRVYVDIGKIRANSKVARLLASIGHRLTHGPYCDNQRYLYIGYDNASGRELAMGEAVCDSLRANGFYASVCADAD